MTTARFQKTVLDHYRDHGRKDLPWKQTRDPYKILVSEIMLQQTQVSRVLPKYREFLREFPTVAALAKAPDAKLLNIWQGLGYWRRAKYLKAAAQKVVETSERSRPNSGDLARGAGITSVSLAKQDEQRISSGARIWGGWKRATALQTLPGVGPYTAGAVACFAFGSAEPFIDTNIRRVYLHFFFPKNPPAGGVSDEQILRLARRALYKKDPRLWHYALFDYGATVLKDRTINRRSRHYAKQSAFTGSFRSFRAYVMDLLLQSSRHRLPKKEVIHSLTVFLKASNSPFKAKDVLESLQKDSLIKQRKDQYFL